MDDKRLYHFRERERGKSSELSLGFVEFELACGILSGDTLVGCFVGQVPWMQLLRVGFTGKGFIKKRETWQRVGEVG